MLLLYRFWVKTILKYLKWIIKHYIIFKPASINLRLTPRDCITMSKSMGHSSQDSRKNIFRCN